jgi:hypothetical protein
MSLFTWLPNRIRGFAGQRRAVRSSPRRQTTFRPRLEVLEGRDVPSTLKVTNLSDSALVKGSLRYEIAAAQSGDTIVIDKAGTIRLSSGNELFIDKNLTIQGPGAGKLTITPYNSKTRIFEVYGTSVTLSGMTFSNGGGNASGYTGSFYDGYGGGVLNHGTLTISGCALTGNSAGQSGGGIYNAGTLTVSSCTLSNNSATNLAGYGVGGGIYNVGWLTVSGCIFSGNSASQGGGIYNDYSAILTVNGSTLSGNSAPGSYGLGLGGGIYNAGRATVTGCTVSANSAIQGGGIYNGGTLTVSDSVFSSNSPDNIYGSYTDGGGNTFK